MSERLRSLQWRPLAAVAFSGSLMFALGAPPHGLPWLPWLGFIPLVLVARLGRMRSAGQCFLLGWCGGLCTGLVGFPWIAQTLERFALVPPWVAWGGLGLFAAWTAVPFGLWVWGVARGPNQGGGAIAWPVILWVALWASWPSLFPYTVVIGFAEQPEWMQGAEWGGIPAVVGPVVLVGVWGADAILAKPGRARVARVIAAVATPLCCTAWGHIRLHQIDQEQRQAPHVRFGVIQPNTPLESDSSAQHMMRLRSMSQQAVAAGAQVLVWPEAGAFPYLTVRPFERDFVDPRRSVLRGHGRPTIFGAGSQVPGERWERNTAYAMAADGRVTGTFDKVILVPFGEYVPVVDPQWAIEMVPSMAHNLAGTGPARFVVEPAPTDTEASVPSLAVGPLICYEDIVPRFVHRVATQPGGIDLFVNLTIDTWFGVTAEPWEHLALAQFRSVEHRIPMVRSVAAGVSTVIDAGGRIVAYRPVRGPTIDHRVPPEFLVHSVPLARNTARDPTPFARYGWYIPLVCQLIAAAVVLAAFGRTLYSRRAKSAGLNVNEPSGEHSRS